MPSVAVVGASADRTKFGNKAVRAYLRKGWTVYPVHPKEATIEGARAYPSIGAVQGPIDRVLLYVPPQVGIALLEAIAEASPSELFVNPGAESKALLERARSLGLEPILACAITEVGESPSAL